LSWKRGTGFDRKMEAGAGCGLGPTESTLGWIGWGGSRQRQAGVFREHGLVDGPRDARTQQQAPERSKAGDVS